MSLYTDYLAEIDARKEQGLNPKPIDDGALVAELIEQIKDTGNEHREPDIGLPENRKFSHSDNHITIEYLGVSLTNPEKVMYRYRLKNFDRDWSPPTTDAKAVYPQLPPGKYTFEVIAMNNDEVWNEVPATWSFSVSPPFWRSQRIGLNLER